MDWSPGEESGRNTLGWCEGQTGLRLCTACTYYYVIGMYRDMRLYLPDTRIHHLGNKYSLPKSWSLLISNPEHCRHCHRASLHFCNTVLCFYCLIRGASTCLPVQLCSNSIFRELDISKTKVNCWRGSRVLVFCDTWMIPSVHAWIDT